jgi:tetratricopeptide (TPR) repeat protein
VTLIRLYGREGRWQAAQNEAQQLIDHFQATKLDKLRAVEFVYWAEAHSVLRQRKQALELLEQGLQKHPRNAELADQLYKASIARADSIRANLTGEYDEMLGRLIRAHELRPSQNDPLFRLAQLTRDIEPIGSKARAAVQQLLESEQPPQALVGIMGSIIGNAGDYESAAGYLDRAYELDPHNALVLNNLAYTLLKLGPSHHQRGLKLIDQALQIRPEEASFRETRGQLLLSLGRYEEAVEDLNLALNGLGDIPDIHRGLATAYRHLDQPDLAEKHEQMAQ